MAQTQNYFMYAMFAVFGFIGLIFLLAMLFGRRVIKKWEYEAEFRGESGREIGDFEIELSKVDKQEPDFTVKVEFHFRNDAIKAGSTVQVLLDDRLVDHAA